MNTELLKTSSNNWVNDLRKQCKSQKPVSVINDSQLRNEDLLDIVSGLLKNFTLSSNQVVLKNILLVVVSAIGLLLAVTIIFGHAIFTSLKTGTRPLIIYVVIMILSFTFYAIKKLVTAKKPKVDIKENEIIIEWHKY